MLPDTNGSPSRQLRPALRSATFIVPSTGERLKRAVTLLTSSDPSSDGSARHRVAENPNENGASSADVRTPLLGTHRRSRRIPALPWVTKLVQVKEMVLSKTKKWAKFWMSKTGQGVLKCSVAYLLGSMGTFLPLLSNILGHHQDGKHMMATVTVYFHPARSQGNMFEALLCAGAAFAYAAFISLTSMGVTVLFDDVLQKIILGHVIVLVVFCGGGLGLVGWIKQRLSNPLVNVGCSLTSLAIITVLTREGSIQAGEFNIAKTVQVLKMVVLGCAASTVVCFVIRPISARLELKQSLIEVTDNLGESLTMITRAFLHGDEEEIESQAFQDLSSLSSKRSVAMTKSLKEAKWEYFAYGQETEYKLEARLVESIQLLSQNIGGLRSAARSQFDLLDQQKSGYGGSTPILSSKASPTFGSQTPERPMPLLRQNSSLARLEAIAETTEEDMPLRASRSNEDLNALEDLPTIKSAREIFDRFIEQLGPSIRSLAYTLRQILDDLPYGPAPEFPITLHPRFQRSLDEAIELYSRARRDALAQLYRSRDMHVSQPRALAADFEEVAASCGYFSYSLQDFAEELRTYLKVVEELQAYDASGSPRSWAWLHFWNWRRSTKARPSVSSDEPLLIVHSNQSAGNHDDPADTKIRTKPHHWRGTTPLQSAWRRQIWNAVHVLRREDIKFATKVGIGAAIYALPSFIPSMREFYRSFRGEWGLLSYMLVCSMTIGSSNTTGFARGWGTCLGAVVAIISWNVSQGNPFALAALGWLMSIATSYIIVAQGNGPLGRFIMLTYNLSCLYAYSLSVKEGDHDEDEGGASPDIFEIAFHRVTAVLVGCAWGIFITRVIWPISARKKFYDGLGILFLRMALIWQRDPLNMLIEDSSPHPYMDLTEEFQLRQYLTQLITLRTSANAEFELRGPFPSAEFARILKSVEKMLDSFHSMNVMMTKDLSASPGEAVILKYTREERAYLSTRISHLFQVLASSLRLQFPLNDALPGTDNARDRLLAKIFRFRRDIAQSKDVTERDYSLLYAYSLVTLQLSHEIRNIGRELEILYGVLDEERLKLD